MTQSAPDPYHYQLEWGLCAVTYFTVIKSQTYMILGEIKWARRIIFTSLLYIIRWYLLLFFSYLLSFLLKLFRIFFTVCVHSFLFNVYLFINRLCELWQCLVWKLDNNNKDDNNDFPRMIFTSYQCQNVFTPTNIWQGLTQFTPLHTSIPQHDIVMYVTKGLLL